MNAGTLQLISIIAFSLAGVLTLISIYLFFLKWMYGES